MRDVDLRFYATLLFQRLPLIILIVTLVTAASVGVALWLPSIYRADAKILIEAPEISASLARSTVQTGAVEQLQVIQQQITTRDNLLALADKLGLYANLPVQPSPADIAEDMRNRIIFAQEQLESGRAQGATVFNVSFDAQNANLAANAVNEIVALILDKNVRERTDRAGETLGFFEKEVDRLGSQLKEVDAEILRFKNSHRDALPDSLDFHRNLQSTQQERILALDREEASLRSRRSNSEMFGQAGDRNLSPDEQTLLDLNRALSDQLAVFSPTSPNVVALRQRIDALQGNLKSRSQSEAGTSAAPKGPTQLDIQLAEIDDRLKVIAQERANLTQSVATLSENIAATPANGAALTTLERNRSNIQSQYDVALARRAEALTGDQIEKSAKGEKFSLVEPAVPPEDPVSPKRRRIVMGGFAGGLGLALGLIVLLEIMNKTIRRPNDVVALFDVEPLATIPYIWVDGEAHGTAWRRTIATTAMAGAV